MRKYTVVYVERGRPNVQWLLVKGDDEARETALRENPEATRLFIFRGHPEMVADLVIRQGAPTP